jgi:hypothetical protein
MPALMTFSATFAPHGIGLLGHKDRPHPPLADLLQKQVGADRGTRLFFPFPLRYGRLERGRAGPAPAGIVAGLQEGIRMLMRPQQPFHARSQVRVSGARRVEEGKFCLGRGLADGASEYRFFVLHDCVCRNVRNHQCAKSGWFLSPSGETLKKKPHRAARQSQSADISCCSQARA